jgi:hypothetical protein
MDDIVALGAMKPASFFAGVVFAGLLVGCAGYVSPDNAPPAPSSSSSGSVDTSDPVDRDHVERSGRGLFAALAAIVAADSAIAFDPTIDPAATPVQNAASIRTHAAPSECAKVSPGTDASVAVDYGAQCVVDGETLSGSLTIAVKKSGATTTLAVTYTNVSVSGMSVSGSATFAMTDKVELDVTLDVTSGTSHVTGKLTAGGGTGKLAIKGAITVTTPDLPVNVRIDDLAYVRGHCYGSTGTITADSTRGTTTYTFGLITPFNGQVTVTKNGVPKDSIALPTYGTCGVG